MFTLGKYSGPNEVGKRLAELEVPVDDEQLDVLIRMVNERGGSAKRAVTDEELRYFADVAGGAAR